MNIGKFVETIKPSFRSRIDHSKRLTLVSGNSSADLDSITSAISYSYYKFGRDQKWIFPIINIPKADLCLRRDVCWLFEKVSVSPENLLFIEDLKLIPENVEVEFVLVDHNTPQGPVADFIVEKNAVIKAIVDHHVDEKQFKDACPRIIEVCGSCSTLVNMLFKDFITENEMDENTQLFLFAGVCTDTSDLQFRAESKDRACVSLFSFAKPLNTKELTASLKKAKNDVKGLTMLDLLRKDYKEFKTREGKLGISSIAKSFHYLLEEYGAAKIEESTDRWIKDRSLFKLAIMTAFNDEEGKFKRELGVTPIGSGFESAEKDLELEYISVSEELNKNMDIYEQHKVSDSRKQVAPLLISYFSKE